ncbi:hypothetical protein BJP40_03565 [Streptomyces sp. CC53]|uniref:hypothetical protein n=1 Tax=unclassified Streptomyces TaxID=2593676 RepID=UPI0008DD7B05|nr:MULTISPECIES: hypothetical protein [unclassified Streptomyces]OII62102.1 hypothetical protein BJP40_03565 [Streptomyces sp. CC53]
MTTTDDDVTPPAQEAPDERRARMRHRRLAALVIALLVTASTTYFLISAEQSRSSGRDKQAESSVTGLQDSWPSKMKRRIFEVPIPGGSTDVAYFETSNWKTSRLYVQFTTSASGLDRYLERSGSRRAALEHGTITVGERDADTVGWSFPTDRDWAATTVTNADPRPTRDITVDRTDPAAPRVYVVSTTTP